MHYYQNSRNNHCKQAILTIFQDFQAEIYLYFFLILQRNYDGILRLHDFFVAGDFWLMLVSHFLSLIFFYINGRHKCVTGSVTDCVKDCMTECVPEKFTLTFFSLKKVFHVSIT